jgi:creatinine amidohydrolase
VIPYGFTGVMDAYPGSFTVSEESFCGNVRAVLVGLAKNNFKNIILLNGHGAQNETAYVLAIDPCLVRRQDYRREMATTLPPQNAWSAYPFPSMGMLYKGGEGHPTFNLTKAKQYFAKVNDKIARLIQETIENGKWPGCKATAVEAVLSTANRSPVGGMPAATVAVESLARDQPCS